MRTDPSHNIWRSAGTLDPIFNPRSIAVIGATEVPGSVGRTLVQNLIGGSFAGKVYPVNPKRASVLGVKAYPSVSVLPERPDLAVIATPAVTVPGIVGECAERGVPAAIVISAGFKERGAEGVELEKRIIAEARGMRIVGPNCLGVMNPVTGMNATFAQTVALPGSVAFISQSGALLTAILDWSLRERFGFSAFVSVGSMLDVGWGDLIDHLSADPHTRAILIYMESLGDARAFLSSARETALTKPIIVLKAGRTTQAAEAARSHTGALCGSDEALNAAFRRCGVLRVDTISELFEMANVLAKQPRPKGKRLAIVTNAGGPGVLATDALVAAGGEPAVLSSQTVDELNAVLPAHWSHGNPVDILGDADPERYRKAIEIVSRDPAIDGLLVVLTPQAMTDPLLTATALAEAVPTIDKPVLASWMGGGSLLAAQEELQKGGVPVFGYPDDACRAFQSMWRYTALLQGLYETPFSTRRTKDSEAARRIIDVAANDDREILTEDESKELLGLYGIPCVQTLYAASVEEAVLCAERVSYPIAMKLRSKTITHKSDIGGVKLGLRDIAALRGAFEDIQRNVQKTAGPAAFEGVTVQPMIDRGSGFELILGASVDAELGPVMLFGGGGELAEIMKDYALGLPPLNTTLALRLMEGTRIFAALRGVRGRKPVPIERLQEILVRFSDLILDEPRIREIDVNPLFASGDGIVALDARVILHPPSSTPPRAPIRPYPSEYTWTFNAGGEPPLCATIRPIRPEDEPLLVNFHKELSEVTVHNRYFHAIGLEGRTAHERLSRVCFNDYDREIALVAEVGAREEGRRVVGVARISRTRIPGEAEFSIVIADALQRRGLGGQMLSRLIEVARMEHIRRLVARILPENTAMRRLCESQGFRLDADGQAHTLNVSMDLE